MAGPFSSALGLAEAPEAPPPAASGPFSAEILGTSARKVPAAVQGQRDADRLAILQSEYKNEYERLKSGKTDAADNIKAIAGEITRIGGKLPDMPPVTVKPGYRIEVSGALTGKPTITSGEEVNQQAYSNAPEATPQSKIQEILANTFGMPFRAAESLRGAGEAGAQLLTGAIGAVPAGLAGLGAAILPGPEGQGAAVTRKIQEALTYQPQTEAGKRASEMVAGALEAGAFGAPGRGEKVLEATGSPAAAVLAEQLTNPLNYLPVAPAALRGARAAARPVTEAMGRWKAELEPGAGPGVSPPGPGVIPSGPVPSSLPPGPTSPLPGALPQLVEQFRQKQGAPAIPGGSVGAAGVTKASEVNNILADASPELQQRVKGIAPESINTEALQTKALEEKHGINLSIGQRTGNLSEYASEWNNRGAHPETLAPLFEAQPRQMMEAIDNLKGTLAPEVFTSSPSELGQTVINSLRQKDAVRLADIDSKYQALRDAAGGELPVDASKLLSNIRERLKKDLHLTDAEGMSQFKELQRLAKDNDMTYDAFLAMRKNLATEARTSTNGTIRNIAGTMIEELEKLPLRAELAELQPLASAARQAAKERFEIIKKNPAYKEAVSLELSPADIEAGIPAKGAELFIDKHTRQKGSLMRLLDEVGKESPAHQAIRMHELEKFKTASGFKEGRGDFTPRGMNNYLHNTKDRLFDIYGPEGLRNLQELAILGSKLEQPKTAVFGRSNTPSVFIMEMAKNNILTGLENYAAAKTMGMSVPAASVAKKFFENKKARQFGEKATDPYGGIVTKE